MANLDLLLEVISDPYNGREEGVDFWVDENGLIQVPDIRRSHAQCACQWQLLDSLKLSASAA